MLGPIVNALGSKGLADVAQNTVAQVGIETTLKAIGRPTAILIDKDISPDTKQYASAKEFLYQVTCLATYLLVVVPIFKQGGFKLAKKVLFKNKPEFQQFEKLSEYEHYLKLTKKSLADRKLTLQKEKVKDKYTPELRKMLETEEKPNIFPLIKGTIEGFNILGSVIGLAILAPQVSHAFIHPVLRAVGLEDKDGNKVTHNPQETKTTGNQANLDTKA